MPIFSSGHAMWGRGTLSRALLVCFVFATINAAHAKPAPPEPVPDKKGARSQKVCQITGDRDAETGQPTKSLTATYFNVPGTDLGSPVEHNGRLHFLFGDTNENARDGIAWTDERDAERCPQIKFITEPPAPAPGESKHFKPIAVEAPEIRTGPDEVPTTGFSAHGSLYVFFRTNYVYPMGTAVLLRSDDDGVTFNHVSREWQEGLGNKFVYLSAVRVSKADFPDLPTNSNEGLLVFGSGEYRRSSPYLAFIDLDELKNGRKVISYFIGTRSSRTVPGLDPTKPIWGDEPCARDLFGVRPRGCFETSAPGCVGELSVTWNSDLHQWLMLYNCEGQILARAAEKPWGPWSEPATLFSPIQDGGSCHFIRGCGCKGGGKDVCAPADDPVSPAKFFADNCDRVGTVYAPYVIPRYTKGERRTVTIYYLMSTWNPYQVVLMKTSLARPGGGEVWRGVGSRGKSIWDRGNRDFHHLSR